MKGLIIVLTMFLTTSIFAQSLSGGDQFSSVNIEGRITVSCFNPQNGSSHGTAYCASNILNPGEFSYFIGPKIDADTVSLQALWENGKSSKIKTEKYDSSTGRSKKSFNLWIQTVLQRPLLDFGKNIVKYKLTKNGIAVSEGEFIVNVLSGETKTCQRTGFYTSNDLNDCAQPRQLCDRYFRDNNYCQ